MITSTTNPRVKRVRALQSRRPARRKENSFVIEGARLIQEAIAASAPVEEVFYTPDFAEQDTGVDLLRGLSELGATLSLVDKAVMKEMSDTQTPQGILGVLPVLTHDVPEDYPFALIIDRISDPGNMGTILRTAAGAGVPLVIITAGTVDLTNPKVVRGAMGAHFHLPIRQYSWEGIINRLAEHVIFLADSISGASCHDVDWTQRCALIVSEEAHGPTDDAKRIAHARVKIPMLGQIESLNVAIATGVLLFERVRQVGISTE